MPSTRRLLACILSLFVLVGFNNCSEKENSFQNQDSAANSLAAENLLQLLEDAKETEARLNEQGSPEAIAQANEIRRFINLIENLISLDGGNMAIDDTPVLDARDYLLNAHLMGRDMLLEYDFKEAIAELQAEDKRLSDLIVQLELTFTTNLAALRIELLNEIDESEASIIAELTIQINKKIDDLQAKFDGFKTQVNNRFISIDNKIVKINEVTNILQNRITSVENNIVIIKNRITKVEDSSESALTALWKALHGVKSDLQAQIVAVQEEQNKMKKQLTEQQQTLMKYLEDQSKLASLQGNMCKLDASGELESGQTACGDASTEDEVVEGTCCMTAENLNCDLMFPGDDDLALLANQQCNAFATNLKNQNDQMKELAETDAQQKADIENLLARVDDLEKVVEELSDEVKIISSDLGKIKNDLAKIDDRLLIVEFKASRAEAGATLNEMSDLYLAWITRRKADVRNRFCHYNSRKAYNMSDYNVAKQNWVYCHERLKWLNQAQELVHLAKAYTHAVMSLNVDQSCSAVVGGKNVETLSIDEIDNSSISNAVIDKCNSGQALTKAYLLNIVKLHNKIGPDFRTAEYMAKKAKIAQLLYFGKEVYQVSAADIQAFENTDPTSAALKNTPYGKVERVFKRRYVETRLRVAGGKYPEDPSEFKPSLAGFNTVYTYKQIDAASTAYLARVEKLELEKECQGLCGYKVTGRNKVARIGQRYSYPHDATTQCPVHNDTVIVPSKDGKHYAYKVNYSRYRGATENLMPQWRWNSNHYPIANSDAGMRAGLFRRCGYRVRHLVHRFGIPDTRLRGRLIVRYGRPYAKTHGLPQCMRFHLSCRLFEGNEGQGEWISPNPEGNLMHYLSGYSTSKVQNACDQSGSAFVVKEREMLEDEKKTIRYYKASQADSGTMGILARITSDTTQLTDDYWVLQDKGVQYGVDNEVTSKATPFYGKSSSHGSPFLRALYRLTDYESIKVQQCYDQGTL